MLFAIIFSMWFVYFVFIESNTFKVSTIKVYGAQKYVNEKDLYEVVKANALTKNILFLNTAKLEKLVKQNFEGAKNFVITKKLPLALEVAVTERVPLGLIYKPDTNEYYMIDEDGYILGLINEKDSSLPKITYNGDIKIGTYLDSSLVPNYILLMKALDDSNLKISSLSFYPKYSEFLLNSGVQVLLSHDKNKEDSVKLIKALITQLAEEKQNATKIDLRYEKVIVSY